MELAFVLAAVTYGLVEGIKEAFTFITGNWTRVLSLGVGVAFTLGIENARVLAEYEAEEWLDVGVTSLVIGLGLTTVFHRTQQAIAAR